MSKRKRRALKRAPTGAFVAVAHAVALSTLVVAALAEEPQEEPTPMRLTYEVDPGLHTCPDEKRFRAMVAKRFYPHRQPPLPDPFRDGPSAQRLDVEVSHSEQHYEVLLVLFDAAGNKLGYSDPPLRGLRCDAAVNQAAGLAAMWLWPLAPPAPLPTQAPPPVTPPAPEARVAKPPESPSPQELPLPDALPPAPPPKPPVVGRAGGMVGVDVRPGTQAAFGLTADVGFKVWKVSLAAQFHAVPVARPSTTGGFDTTLLAGRLVACWRFDEQIGGRPLAVPLCLMGEGGQIQSGQGGANPLYRAGFFAGGGVGLGVEIPVGKTLYISAAGELLGMVQAGISSTPPMVADTVKGLGGGVHAGAGFNF